MNVHRTFNESTAITITITTGNFYQLPVLFFQTVFANQVIVTGTGFYFSERQF